MAYTPKILAFAGSLRKGSFNKKIARIAVSGAEAAGAAATYIDLAEFPLPVYDGDLEEKNGLPANALKLKELMLSHQGFLIASPEYNSSVAGGLKNTIDWCSRAAPGEATLACFRGKTAALMSASPGALGGLRSLAALRSILENIGVLVLPTQVAVGKAHEALGADGLLKDRAQQDSIANLGKNLADMLRKLHASPI